MLDSRRRRLGARPTFLVVAAATVAVVALRLPFLHNNIYPDEGGMLVVGREWHTGGPFLYGDYFLARPPLIILLFRLAGAAGGILVVRLIGIALVAVVVVMAAWAGKSLSGRRGAITAAVVSAALLTDPTLGTSEIDAETVGIPFTMTAAACLLAAMNRPRGTRGRAWLLAAGGASAVAAMLAKQNLADGLAFGLVLVIGSGLAEGGTPRALLPDLGWLGLGVAVPVALTLVWAATSTPGVHEVLYELYGFRAQGGQAVLAQPTSEQNDRLHSLINELIRSGLVPVVLASLWLLRRRWWREPVTLALLAMLVTALVGIAGGGQYWIHYALGLVPVTALIAARAVGQVRWPRLLVALVLSTVVITLMHVNDALPPRASANTWVGGTTTWLDSAKKPGDSMVVLYGQAGLYETTRLRPAYPYLWTLPMRVLDPQLNDLKALLSGPDAPTFVMVRMPLNSWGIDPDGQVQRTIDQHYQQVAVVCGTPMYVRDGVDRPTPPPPTGCG